MAEITDKLKIELKASAVGDKVVEKATQVIEKIADELSEKLLFQFQAIMRMEMARINRIISKEYNPDTDELTDEAIKLLNESPYVPKIRPNKED